LIIFLDFSVLAFTSINALSHVQGSPSTRIMISLLNRSGTEANVFIKTEHNLLYSS